jgi:hypothetical protein
MGGERSAFIHEVLPLGADLMQFLRRSWQNAAEVEDLCHPPGQPHHSVLGQVLLESRTAKSENRERIAGNGPFGLKAHSQAGIRLTRIANSVGNSAG